DGKPTVCHPMKNRQAAQADRHAHTVEQEMAGTEASRHHCPNLPTPTMQPRAPPTTRNGTSQTAPAKALQQPQDETGASAWEAAFAIAPGQRNHTDEPQLECSQGPQAHAKGET